MRTDLALAALASAAVPGMKPVAVAAVGPGDDGRARELQTALVEDATGRRWVVRAPLTPMAGARLQRNDELVRQLSRHVPFKVPAAAGYAPVGKDGSAAVYPHVEGSPLDLRRLPAGPGLASAVGRALAAVHNIPRAVFEEQDVPVFDASGARQRAIAEVDRAAETGRVPTGLLARWEEAFEAAPLWQFATTPVHGAFTGASVVVAFTDEDDAATGRVVAVTDWDEAMVGDPAVDLAELWARSSPQAWEAVLDSYTLARAHRPDPYLHARARLVAELSNLRGLAHAVAEGDEDTARRCVEALRRMDRLTEADDSLVPVTARPSGARPTRPGGTVVPSGEDQPPGSDLPAEPATARPGDDAAPAEDGLPDVPADDASAVAEPGPDGSAASGSHELRAAGEADPTMEVPPLYSGEAPVGPDGDPTVQIDTTDVAAPHETPDQTSHRWAEVDAGAEETDPEVEELVPDPPTAPEVPDSPEMSGTTERFSVTWDDDGAAGTDVDDAADSLPPPTGSTTARDAGSPAWTGGEDVEELPDEERLHELYGMPTPDRDADSR